MASQAEIYKKKIEEYKSMPGYDPAVLTYMNMQLNYANTIDHDLAKKASQILNSWPRPTPN